MFDCAMNHAPWRLSGSVYGALLNHRPELAALGDAINQAPYKAPPQAPVLSVMPRHMLAADGAALVLPPGAAGLHVGAALGIVIGRVACRLPVQRALDFVAGYVLMGEVTLPLSSHYRPALRLRARDGFCPMSKHIVAAHDVADPDTLTVRVTIDGQTAHTSSTAERVRSVAQLLADVTAFMTLQAGDVLSLGRCHGAPLVHLGQGVGLHIRGLGSLHHPVVAEAAVEIALA